MVEIENYNQVIKKSKNGENQDRLWVDYIDQFKGVSIPEYDQAWETFKKIYKGRRKEDGPPLLWQPGKKHSDNSNIGLLLKKFKFNSFRDLYMWSVEDRESFWEMVIKQLEIRFEKRPAAILDLDKGVEDPRWLPGAELNCIDSCFKVSENKPAILIGQEGTKTITKITYGQLNRLVNRVSNGLVNSGFKPGDAVALYMPMNKECIAAYLGIIRAGCSVVSIAESFSPKEVEKRLKISKTDCIITMDGFTRKGKIFNLYERLKLPRFPRVIVLPSGTFIETSLRKGDLLWDDFLGSDREFRSVTGDPYRTVNILFSSGTTGTPKAIPWNHLTPIKCAMDGFFHQDIHPDDIVAWPTSIGWMMGPWLIFATLINGAAMALYEGAPVGTGFANFIKSTKVSILGLVPSLVSAWRSSGGNMDFRWIRLFSSTGEPSNLKDYFWLMSQSGFKTPVIEYCGGTEIGGGHLTGAIVQPASPATFTTPALGIEIKILREDGKPARTGETGEVFIVPPSIGLSQSLLNKDHKKVYYEGCPEGTNGEVLRRHGDLAVPLPDGFIKAAGRADDTMNLGGIKAGSIEIEKVINKHPSVIESAAVGIQPVDSGGDRLFVFVKISKDCNPETLTVELGRLIAKNMNPLFKIGRLIIIENLPRTASNKIMRRKLREKIIDDLKSEQLEALSDNKYDH